MVGGSSQGIVFAALNSDNLDHIFLQPRLEQSSIWGGSGTNGEGSVHAKGASMRVVLPTLVIIH